MVAEVIRGMLTGAARVLARSRGTVPEGQCLLVANHASHLDALLILASLPAEMRGRTRPLAAADYWEAGGVRRYVSREVVRAVLIGRNCSSLAPLKPAANALAAGDSLILFPEGTRGPGGDLQALKAGVFHLARAFPDVPVVPVWIEGSHRVLPKGASIPKPRACGVRFGTALRVSEAEYAEAFLARLRRAMEGLR